MVTKERKVFTEDEFTYSDAKPGDLVAAEVVMAAMECLPPETMDKRCAQMGEPYSSAYDPFVGKYRQTYATFKCIEGNFLEGTWEYCGHCFSRETVSQD